MTTNVLQLKEVGDFGDESFLTPLNRQFLAGAIMPSYF